MKRNKLICIFVPLLLLFAINIIYAQSDQVSLLVDDFQNIIVKKNNNTIIDIAESTSGNLNASSLKFSWVKTPSNGTAKSEITDNGTRAVITYIPKENYTGPDSFIFKTALSKTPHKVSVIVNPPPELTFIPPPEKLQPIKKNDIAKFDIAKFDIAKFDKIDIAESTSGNLIELLVKYSLENYPSHGTVNLETTDNGTRAVITYTPEKNYTGPDSFIFKTALSKTPHKVSVIVNPPNSELIFIAPPEQRVGLAFGLSLVIVLLIFLITYLIIRRIKFRKKNNTTSEGSHTTSEGSHTTSEGSHTTSEGSNTTSEGSNTKPKKSSIRFWDIIRDDNWYPSLAIFQFLLWTGIVLFSYLGIAFSRLFSGGQVFIDIPYTLIIVMGISAAVPVVGAVVSEFKYGETTPPSIGPTKEPPSDRLRRKLPGFKTMLMENDKITLPRFQMFAWTWIGIIAYLALVFWEADKKLGYLEELILPGLPMLFVSLMGLTQVTYLTAKSVKAPFSSISEVRPRRLRLQKENNQKENNQKENNLITIIGSNFGNAQGTVWIELYPPITEDEKRYFEPPYSEKEKIKMTKKEIAEYEKDW